MFYVDFLGRHLEEERKRHQDASMMERARKTLAERLGAEVSIEDVKAMLHAAAHPPVTVNDVMGKVKSMETDMQALDRKMDTMQREILEAIKDKPIGKSSWRS